MNFKELALIFDARKSPLETAWAYEIAINEPDTELEIFLNLAVLYFVCVDAGYASHHKLSEDFVSSSWARAFEVLKKAKERFGDHTEIEFWRLYFSFIHIGEEPIDKACMELAKRKDSLAPYLYLFTSSGKTKYLKEAQELLESVKDRDTERKRYVKSILE